MNSTTRFGDRVEQYVRYRPGYPPAVIRTLVEETGLAPFCVVADVGSGTGISAVPFLDHGCTVYGVEPNDAMRSAAEALLAERPGFVSVNGTAEATSLGAASVDYVVAGQAFHWFDAARARAEFARILRTEGWVVLLWNTRLVDDSPFLREYEALLQEFGTDYAAIDHRNIDANVLRRFFGHEPAYRAFRNSQRFDHAGLRGRLLSSSYAPNVGQPRHAEMLRALEAVFRSHQRDGRVELRYATEVFFGRLDARP